jgi:hypothetical protein
VSPISGAMRRSRVRHRESGDSTAVWVLVLGLIGLYLLQCSGGLPSWSGPAAYQRRDDCCYSQHWDDRSYEVPGGCHGRCGRWR